MWWLFYCTLSWERSPGYALLNTVFLWVIDWTLLMCSYVRYDKLRVGKINITFFPTYFLSQSVSLNVLGPCCSDFSNCVHLSSNKFKFKKWITMLFDINRIYMIFSTYFRALTIGWYSEMVAMEGSSAESIGLWEI